MNELSNGWRDEYETHPDYQAILTRMEKPWWKRPLTLATGSIAVLAAVFFLGVWLGGSDDGSGSSSPAPFDAGAVGEHGTEQPAKQPACRTDPRSEEPDAE